MAVAQNLLVNPSDKTKRYIVWSNGYIQPLAATPPVAQTEQVFGQPYVGPSAPTFYWLGGHPVAAAVVTTWGSNPAGYTLDIWGTVYEWGGASTVPGPDHGAPNVAYYQPVFGFYSDFVMNPAGNGQGYVLNYDGDLLAIGTGTPAIAHAQFLAGSGVQALRVVMDWTSKRYWVIDSLGRIWGMNGGNNLTLDGLPALGYFGDQIQYALALYDKSAAGKGWAVNQYGLVMYVGGAQDAVGSPYDPSSRIWQDIAIIDDGTGANPLKLAVLNELGQVYEYVVSTAPTVQVTQPNTSTVTDTSRPFVGWAYRDNEGDAQSYWEVAIFTSAVYGGGGFDPASSSAVFRANGSDAVTRGVQCTVDLTNGTTYRAYVRCRDTSNLTSAWAFFGWTQSIIRPATPTVTPTVNGALTGISLLLHVNPAGLPANTKLGVQYHDADWDGTTWLWVKNGWDLTPNGSGDATVVDYGAGYGVQRTYRAVAYVYNVSTGTWNGSDFSTVANATITDKTKWTLSSADNNDAMVVQISPDISFVKDVSSTMFWAAGRRDPIVVRDGSPRLAAIPMTILSLTNATRVALEVLLNAEILLLRDPFGNRHYVAFVESQTRGPLRAAPLTTETTPLRDANTYAVKVQAVARPRTGPLTGPLAV